MSLTRVPIRYWLTPELVVTCSRVDCHEASEPGPVTTSRPSPCLQPSLPTLLFSTRESWAAQSSDSQNNGLMTWQGVAPQPRLCEHNAQLECHHQTKDNHIINQGWVILFFHHISTFFHVNIHFLKGLMIVFWHHANQAIQHTNEPAMTMTCWTDGLKMIMRLPRAQLCDNDNVVKTTKIYYWQARGQSPIQIPNPRTWAVTKILF